MSNSKYNGWTNFETWKVALEIFDGCDELMGAEECEQFAEELIFQDAPPAFESIARAFLAEVNWHEIAHSLHEDCIERYLED